jgi:RND family efflux transporter MFP subunit
MRLVWAMLLVAGCREPSGEHTRLSATDLASAEAPRATAGPRTEGFVGVLLARESVDVSAKFEGHLDTVRVRLGDRVTRGASLASLDVRSVKRDLQQGEAALRVAIAEKEKAALELKEAKERLARRQAPLAAGIPAVSGDELATAQYREQQAGPGVEIANARVAEKQARVDQLRQMVEDAEIRAPFDGVVAARFVDPGALVGPRTPIVRLISGDDLWVRFAVPEDEARRLVVGQAVRVEVSGWTAVLEALVEKVAPEVDAAARMIFAEAKLKLPDGTDRNGLSGRVARVYLTR